jgi:hypothetical protein
MTKMHSIEEYHPLPPIDMRVIFTTGSNKILLRNDAFLYRDILAYGKEKNDGFKSTEVGNWLLQNNIEFRNEFSGNKAKTPPSTRLAIKRNRIQRHIHNLIRLGLIYEKTTVKNEKNQSPTPLYDFTVPGYLLAWLLDIKMKYEKKEKKIQEAVQKVLDVIHSYVKGLS